MRIQAYNTSLLSCPVDSTDVDAWTPPDSLQWMPVGKQTVSASKDGQPAEVTVDCSPDDAARLDAQLQEMLAKSSAGQSSRPFIDFDHEGKEAAAIPVRFFWMEGIRLAVEWTESGAEALRGREYSYFSPEFLLGEDGHPSALPSVGPIGALVNTPAFQNIERLAAASTEKEKQMADNANAEALAAMNQRVKDLEATLLKSQEEIKAALATVQEREAKIAELQTVVEAALKAEAESIVSEAVKAGKVKDEATLKAKWVAAVIKNKVDATELLNSIEAAKVTAGHPSTQLPSGNPVKTEETKTELTGLAKVQSSCKKQLDKLKLN